MPNVSNRVRYLALFQTHHIIVGVRVLKLAEFSRAGLANKCNRAVMTEETMDIPAKPLLAALDGPRLVTKA